MKAIVIHEHGEPASVARCEEQDSGAPEAGEVLVEMRAAPINPVDLNVIEGKYPVLPKLPATPGTEGAGVITAVGENVAGLKKGQSVLLSHRAGSWREALVVKESEVVPLPGDIPIEQAAMLRINPPTAWRMLHDFVSLRPGDWVLQNAANSGVGRAVIQIAHSLGVKTVNVVRRAELIEELKGQGADVVLVDGEDLRDQIREATGRASILLALNAVGGESALRLAAALARGGTIVTYGAMGRQPLRIPNGFLIFKDQRWRGFWVTQWFQDATREQRNEMFSHLFPLAQKGVLHTPVEQTFAIDQVTDAIKRAQENRRAGKVQFRLG